MKQVLLIGVGGTGSRAIDILTANIKKMGNQVNSEITSIVFDTDNRDVQGISNAVTIPLTDSRNLGTLVKQLGHEILEDWFPCYESAEALDRNLPPITPYSNQNLLGGAGQWRKKSFFAFLNMMHDDARRTKFENALRRMAAHGGTKGVYDIYVVASIAGGTGSGSFIPLTLYARKFLKETCNVSNVNIYAFLSCPDVYLDVIADETERTKIQANAYAILRELNAMNMVAYGHNDPSGQGSGFTPIHFRLGHEKDMKVGLLFDADNKDFWTPNQKPFNKIFLFDRVNNLKGVPAHDSVMASALYILSCTAVGDAFAGRTNNQDQIIADANKHNAIYASLSAMELEYPINSIMDYVAHKSTITAVEGDWLHIYDKVERMIAVRREEARRSHQRFFFNTRDYAEFVTDAIEKEYQTQTATGDLLYILNLGMKNTRKEVDADGNEITVEEDRLSLYLNKIDEQLKGKLDCDAAKLLRGATDPKSPDFQKPIDAPKFMAGATVKRQKRAEMMTRVENNANNLKSYYEHAVRTIRREKMTLLDAILPTDGKLSPTANPEWSLVSQLLMKDGKYIHPIAAYGILAKLVVELTERVKGFNAWDDVTAYKESFNFDMEFLTSSAADDEDSTSSYVFSATAFDPNRRKAYIESNRNKPEDDSVRHQNDLQKSFESISGAAEAQFCGIIWSTILTLAEELLESYRRFFENFTDAKNSLVNKTAELRTADEGVDAKFIICASGEDKDDFYNSYVQSTEQDEAALEELYSVSGGSVFNMLYDSVVATVNNQPGQEMNLDGLFSAIIKSYRDQLTASKYYQEQSAKGALQVLLEYYMNKNSMTIEEAAEEVSMILNDAKTKAAPSLGVTGEVYENIVLLLNGANAAYLTKKQKELHITSFNKPEDTISTFLANIGFNSQIEVSDDTPPGSIYIARMVDSLQPVDIEKLNEVGKGAKYYQNYLTSLKKMREGKNDMFNPHLGMTLHKHGNLPYINPDMEEVYGVMLAKATLYTVMHGLVTYRSYSRMTSETVFFASENGIDSAIRYQNRTVKDDNLADLVGWLRERDDIVEERAKLYDKEVSDALNTLPLLIGEDTQVLTAAITNNEMVKLLRTNLFAKLPGATASRNLALNLLEFAYRIKLTEENYGGNDFNDAEKILKVGFETLQQFCFSRLNPKDGIKRSNIYTQQLHKFIGEFLYDDDVQAVRGSDSYVRGIIQWANEQGCFLEMDEWGNTAFVNVDAAKLTDEAKRAEADFKLRNAARTSAKTAPRTDLDVPTANDTPTDTPTEA